MRHRLLVLASLMVMTCGLTLSAVHAQTYLVSQSSSGQLSNDFSAAPSISADGRYVAFESSASNLVAGDTNGVADIFVHDRQTGTTARVSVGVTGAQADSNSVQPSISADGRYVAFTSFASNLVPGDTNGDTDVFVHDRQSGVTTRVSVGAAQIQANNGSSGPSISGDGRYVAFESLASNLVPGNAARISDIFVYDRQTGVTALVSVPVPGLEGDTASFNPSISSDGRYVAFLSFAPTLVPGDTNSAQDIFVYDRQTGETTRVSVGAAGLQANGDSFPPSISADGRYVAFDSFASNLVAGDTNEKRDIFVHDRQAGVTTRVSVGASGAEANDSSRTPSISSDGRYVAFRSTASNLVAGDTNNTQDSFVHDRQTGVTTRVSVGSAGTQANSSSSSSIASISADGRYVAFGSGASNLVTGDTNNSGDIFVRDTRPCLGDADDDRTVNFTDVTTILGNFGNLYPRSTGVGDATLDGVVDFPDITTVLANFGAACD